jgi:hypothetical protein
VARRSTETLGATSALSSAALDAQQQGVDAKVATPKGMRALQYSVNPTDAIHVYSDETHIWLQIRRDVPTEQDIGRSSFKVALCLQPGTAHKLGLELMNIADKNLEKLKAKSKASAPAKGPKAKSGGQ